MPHSPYDLMQMAVDIVDTSPHPTNKIAATISGTAPDGNAFALARTNFWPAPIMRAIGPDTKIGNSSGTVHAETACIIDAPKTKGAKIFITDPPCPNCVKNIAEAGIKKIYIDHKGFDKDWAKRNGDAFENMALRLCERSGIAVYEIWRKEQRIEEILGLFNAYTPALEKPAQTKTITDEGFKDLIARQAAHYGVDPFALALATNHYGDTFMLSAEPHLVIGYTSNKQEKADDKYSYALEPINRLLMNAARKGLAIDTQYLYCSRTPSARELVNMVGAGLDTLMIGDKQIARDEHGPKALKQLMKAGILQTPPHKT